MATAQQPITIADLRSAVDGRRPHTCALRYCSFVPPDEVAALIDTATAALACDSAGLQPLSALELLGIAVLVASAEQQFT